MLEIDVPTLMASALPGDRRETSEGEGASPLEDISLSAPAFDWAQVLASVAVAEQYARDGYRMPVGVGRGMAGRMLQRACARVALFVQSCFRSQQQQRWDSVLKPLRSLTQHAQETDARMAELATVLPQIVSSLRQAREASQLLRQSHVKQERAFNEALNRHQCLIPVLNLGLADEYLEHASREELLAHSGLDADGIGRSVREFLANLARMRAAPARAGAKGKH